jgi:hypothetical protein
LAERAVSRHFTVHRINRELRKDRTMRDEMDGRMWVAHHDAFSRWAGDAAAGLRSALTRLSTWDGTAAQLFVLVASFAITALSFNATAA